MDALKLYESGTDVNVILEKHGDVLGAVAKDIYKSKISQIAKKMRCSIPSFTEFERTTRLEIPQAFVDFLTLTRIAYFTIPKDAGNEENTKIIRTIYDNFFDACKIPEKYREPGWSSYRLM
jgi:hypothetical protein